MPLEISVRLRGDRYDAAGIRPGEPEWPPHPARLFCALTASAASDPDWAALRWLEAAGPPEVWANPVAAPTARRGYVVTNTTQRSGGSQTWPGRTNGLRTRAGVVPADPHFAVVWPDARPGPDIQAALARLARRIPYLGRTTCPVTMAVGGEPGPRRPGWVRYVPVRIGQPSAAALRVPFPGYTSQLLNAYGDGRRAWEVTRPPVPYDVRGSRPALALAAAVASPFADLVVFGLARGAARFSGQSLLSLTVTLRQALISRIATAVPAQVSGHGADGRPHVAYLALVDAGHRNADGHVLGVALAIPAEMPAAEVDQVLAATVEDRIRCLTVRRGHDIAVEYDPLRAMPFGLLADRWTGQSRGGMRRWVTVTPLMLDRHPRRARTLIAEVAQALVRAGYPAPAEVEVSPAALMAGAVHRPRLQTIPAGRPHLPMTHARVTFGQPVTGPVLAGSMRYLGLGLFAPEPGPS